MKKLHLLSLTLALILGMVSCGGNNSNPREVEENDEDNDIDIVDVGTRPLVIDTNLDATALNVATNRSIKATFDLPMNEDSVIENFSISPAVAGVTAYFDADSTTIIFAPADLPPSTGIGPATPLAFLADNTEYTVTIDEGAKDSLGVSLLEDYVWSFTTGTSINELPVFLGLTDSFVVIGGAATAGSAPPTLMTGDFGSVGALTGFTDIPNQIIGTVYSPAADSTVPVAVTDDVAIVYADMHDRNTAPSIILTNVLIAAGPLSPGIYKSVPAITVTSNIILDAGNDRDATFIFQITGAFGLAAGVQVILQGGADANNVFFQSEGAVDLATNTVFNGTLATPAAVTTGANAVITAGRMMSTVGAIALSTSNTFSIPQ